ncbi:MAG TPA: LuxR family transcriptional regulator [Afifellaceae bacterium]|nr:LuxR family transcriptional regulator [Afifellaceae bacterium]
MEEVLRHLSECAGQFGLDHFILTGLPLPRQRLEPLVLLNGWPQGWFERYDSQDYFAVDGVGQWALRTYQPYLWNEIPDDYKKTAGSQRVNGEARAFGLMDGFLVPMYSAQHWQAVLSFASSVRCSLTERERAALHLISVYASGAVRQLLGDYPSPSRLTEREREVLCWAAHGKTAWETSVILSISESTVIKHLQHVRDKLDVATTAQAVAEGLRQGEIAY